MEIYIQIHCVGIAAVRYHVQPLNIQPSLCNCIAVKVDT